MGLDGRFTPPQMWDLVEPFAFGRYNVPLVEFVYAYSVSAEKLGADKLKGLEVESTKTELNLRII